MCNFKKEFEKQFQELKQQLSTDDGQWVVKGFIDIYKNIYTISTDTKVISKVIELMMFPIIAKFANEYNYTVTPCKEQNHYPDLTFQTKKGNLIAVDIKSTFRKNKTTVNGMTLGAFTGYFRKRESNKNILFPYKKYDAHYVLGVIYTRGRISSKGKQIHTLAELESITSVIKDFEFFLQEKWKIASYKPGSGNTKNIGSVNAINDLINGLGPFSKYSVEVFDDYWMNYLTKDMAKKIDSEVSYTNLESYFKDRGSKYKK